MTFNFDPAVVAAILAAGGIGLVYVVNFLKNIFKVSDKPAVLLVLIVSAIATALTLLISGGFGWLAFAIYTLATFGTMTGWFKFTKPA